MIESYVPALYKVGLYETIINNVHVVDKGSNKGDTGTVYILSNGQKSQIFFPIHFLLDWILILFPLGIVCFFIKEFFNGFICENFEEKADQYRKEYQKWKTDTNKNNEISSNVPDKNS
jgi:hypothetical protein